MRRPTIWYVRGSDNVPDRARNRPKCIKEAWEDPDFTILTPTRMKRLGKRARADIAIVAGAKAARLLRQVIDVERRAALRVFIPAWQRSRRHFKGEVKEAHRGDYHLVLPDQRTWLGGFREAHRRVHFVDRGFDPKVFFPLPEEEKTRWVVFCGNYQAFGRLNRLRVMVTHFPGRVEWTQGIPHTDMAAFLRSGRIGWNQILKCSPVGINYRVWEHAGSGLLNLCSRSSCVARVLKDGEQAVLWDSEADLLDKVRYYQGHDKERVEIARRGYEEALSKHTWAHRGRQYRELIEACL